MSMKEQTKKGKGNGKANTQAVLKKRPKSRKKDAGLSRNIFERQKDTVMVRRCLVYKLMKVSKMSKSM